MYKYSTISLVSLQKLLNNIGKFSRYLVEWSAKQQTVYSMWCHHLPEHKIQFLFFNLLISDSQSVIPRPAASHSIWWVVRNTGSLTSPQTSGPAALGSGPATWGLQAFQAIIMYYSKAIKNSRLCNVGDDLMKILVSYPERWHLMSHCKQHENAISHYKSFHPFSPHGVLLLATALTPFSL